MKDEPTTIICAAEQVAMDGVPEEIKILPLGMVHNVHQDFLVDDESCRAIINQFANRKIEMCIRDRFLDYSCALNFFWETGKKAIPYGMG